MNENEMTEVLENEISEENTVEIPDETEVLKGEIERLKGELEGCYEREKSNSRILSECAEFGKYFPDTPLDAVPDEVWESVKDGIPLSYSYALYEKKLALARESAKRINARNREMSSGAVSSLPDEHYFSPDEVKRMSASDVRKNYSDIVESMKHWH